MHIGEWYQCQSCGEFYRRGASGNLSVSTVPSST